MSEPWFDGPTAGLLGAAGGMLGSLGGLYGAAVGFLAPRGKAKGFVFATHSGFQLIGFAMLVVAAVAVLDGQPFHVWHGFALMGFILSVLFTLLWRPVRQQYRAAEERKMTASDLT